MYRKSIKAFRAIKLDPAFCLFLLNSFIYRRAMTREVLFAAKNGYPLLVSEEDTSLHRFGVVAALYS